MSENKVVNKRPEKLTEEQFNQLANALARLHEIRNTEVGGAIITAERKAEAAKLEQEALGIIEFISTTMIAHAQEFLGCWRVVQSEYNPLVNGFINFFNRLAVSSHDLAQQRNAAMAAMKQPMQAQTDDSAAPKNVVRMPTLPKKK